MYFFNVSYFPLTWSLRTIFQSTHSIQSATSDYEKILTEMKISIHALHTECDTLRGNSNSISIPFQSTHSIQSATIHDRINVTVIYDFNPRTPYRVRRQTAFRQFRYLRFQSTHSIQSAKYPAVDFAGTYAEFQSTHSIQSATRTPWS
ncbi:hypothetical protein PAEAM_38130 [Paenibacillus sp. GM1FR]|nr:hypothetical protein PAEAM_38130 [Paenibacillus sp. GM1FR]